MELHLRSGSYDSGLGGCWEDSGHYSDDCSTVKDSSSNSATSTESTTTEKCRSLRGNVYLNITNIRQYEDFLMDLRPGFVKNMTAPPLIDLLIQEDVLNQSESSNFKKDGRSDQARRLWSIFHTLSVNDFKRVVFPFLVEKYPHIIPKKYCLTEPPEGGDTDDVKIQSTCLHHNLKGRLEISTFADLLIGAGCLSRDKYREITEIYKESPNDAWKQMFDACCDHHDSTSLKEALQKTLAHYKLPVPEELEAQLSLGVPCTCRCSVDDVQFECLSSEGQSVKIPGTRGFQSDNSQYLGSDDLDFDISTAVDAQYREWAHMEGLADATLRMLLKEDISSITHLLDLETWGEIKSCRSVRLLPKRQQVLLKRAFTKLSAETKAKRAPGLNTFIHNGETERIMLVGKTGSGKSATGNTILGEKEGVKFRTTLSMGSETRTCELGKSDDGKAEVIDCPGLFDTDLTMKEACDILLSALLRWKTGLTAFGYVLRIGDRYTKEELGTFKRLKAIFGDNITDHMIIIFTRGDDLKKQKQDIKDYIKQAPQEFHEVFRECGERYVVFDNTDTGKNSQQIEDLRDAIQSIKEKSGRVFQPEFSPDQEDQCKQEVYRRIDQILKPQSVTDFVYRTIEAFREKKCMYMLNSFKYKCATVLNSAERPLK